MRAAISGKQHELEEVSSALVWRTWFPLAASWLLMGAELPLLSAVVARLPSPEIHLAAYGGVVFPIALIIESPIIMLLAASTALSRDWASYRRVRRFMMWSGAALTGLHVAVAFTPLYDFIARHLIGAPDAILEPARTGLQLMTPWTWAIAYRRFQQGVLIRFGHSDAVGWGTAVRLGTHAMVLLAGVVHGRIPGIVVATIAVSTGVVSEALYAWYRVRPVLKRQVCASTVDGPPLTWGTFFAFYVPLALTSFFTLLVQPVVTSAISRMPNPIPSLAAWPAVNGSVFMFRALGMASNEVVVALMDRPGGHRHLERFTWHLSILLTLGFVIAAATPFAGWWFGTVSGLPVPLQTLATESLWAALPLPALAVWTSWYQGLLMHQRTTRPITESVVGFLFITAIFLAAAGAWQWMSGLTAGLAALSVGSIGQAAWQSWSVRRASASK